MTTHAGPDRRTAPRRSTLYLSIALHLLALWPYAISGLAAPGWAVLALLVVWAALGAVLLQVHRVWGAVAAVVPLVAVVLWFGLITLGEAVLGWTG